MNPKRSPSYDTTCWDRRRVHEEHTQTQTHKKEGGRDLTRFDNLAYVPGTEERSIED